MDNVITPELSWAIVGVILLVAEVVTGTFILLFLGAAALLTGLITWLGLQGAPYQILAFSLLSALGILFFRKKVRQVLDRTHKYSTDQHQTVQVSEDIPAGGVGKIQYQGTPWTAVNESPEPLKAGGLAVIIRTEGVKLILRAPDSTTATKSDSTSQQN